MRQSGVVAIGVFCALILGTVSVLAQGSRLPSAPTAMGTAFTYQGQLKRGGAPVTSTCGLSFKLYADPGGTTLVAGPVSGIPNAVSVSNGLFTVQIDFGVSAFGGEPRWLQTLVQCTGDSGPTALALQSLAPVPYALFAAAPWVSGGNNLFFTGGSVGIGTSNPATLLHVDSGNYAAIYLGDNGPNGFHLTKESTDNSFNIWSGTFGSGANRLKITSAGNVGIGTTTPTAQLDVESGNNPSVYGVYTGSSLAGRGVVGASGTGFGVSGLGGNIGVYAHNSAVNGHDAYLASPCCAGDFYGDVKVHGALTTDAAFVHTAHTGIGGNVCAGNSATVLDNAYINNNPNAILIVTPSTTGAVTFAYTPFYAVWSGGGYGIPACPANRWTLHTMNLNDTLSDGLQYNVLVINP